MADIRIIFERRTQRTRSGVTIAHYNQYSRPFKWNMQQQYSGRKVGVPPERVAEAILQLAGRCPPVASGRSMPLPG
ncbi:MAG: hypothetical protein ACREYE_00440 [Gammaproteobacteria bacterium]